ncbi:hypothetical protein Hore_12460 [Halothermothrix orenii H 168]|uniref:Uncharacterized protein n=1 Tax=Halothermothrix orenii (strain H 168 / OCM 544 / DSM 9562) TaxID=373903 RepID=B8CXH7_HALOH|nr:hypothetical protein Hore_12460 [Halothermothrix orenii H 168]
MLYICIENTGLKVITKIKPQFLIPADLIYTMCRINHILSSFNIIELP